MRTYTTEHTVYKFDELDEDTKQAAIEKLWDINVDHDWWDLTTDFWVEKLAAIGFIDAKIWFSGFSSQGDGACFDATVDLQVMSNNMFYCANSYKEARLWRAINIAAYNGMITNPKTYIISNHYSHENTRRIDTPDIYLEDNVTTSKIIDLLESIESLRYDLSREIYKDLETEHDYLTSKESIIETIESNEYEFDENGNLA